MILTLSADWSTMVNPGTTVERTLRLVSLHKTPSKLGFLKWNKTWFLHWCQLLLGASCKVCMSVHSPTVYGQSREIFFNVGPPKEDIFFDPIYVTSLPLFLYVPYNKADMWSHSIFITTIQGSRSIVFIYQKSSISNLPLLRFELRTPSSESRPTNHWPMLLPNNYLYNPENLQKYCFNW